MSRSLHSNIDLDEEISRLRKECKRLQRAKEVVEEECRVLFDGSLEALIIVHGDTGKILKANEITERILGYKKNELEGKNFSILSPQEKDSDVSSTINKVKMYDNVIVETFRHANGTNCVMDMTANMIPWGKDSAFLVTLRDVTERVKAEEERDRLFAELQEAMEKIKTLKGIVPICASCKKIRNDEGYWQQVEEYVRDHSEAEFSHGICPDCMKKLYPDL